MRKFILSVGMLCITCSIVESQTPIKARLTPIVAGIPDPPKSMDEAYNIAHVNGGGNPYTIATPQSLYPAAKAQIEKAVAQLEPEKTKTEEEAADEAVAVAAAGNAFVRQSPEMQNAMRELQIRFQTDPKFAESFEKMTEQEKVAFLQKWNNDHRVKAPSGPLDNSKDANIGKEIQEFQALSKKMQIWQQMLKSRFYNQIMQSDADAHRHIDEQEQQALAALPDITSGEYTGPDPVKTKEIQTRYLNAHLQQAKLKLEKDAKTLREYRTEYITGLANFDNELAGIKYGDKYHVPALKSGVGGLQKALLEIANDLIYCNQQITVNAANWHVKSLDQPTTVKNGKSNLISLLYISF
ncbi:hypothetical protein SAMN05660909_00312 [Chitinophaga terrae (ex Kim and Jung 2007)]|uniref:Uncharacterized protein n=1 Tax=Chitinophaga terrae (ex Kim and Jung 2007) TaxID=408074 RepID=A0A1H3X7P8_9BACT|nr:hypothetical protein [Chitinophaga terrae (ex Kim and Jung 2007)]MDQ0106838.1 hypothetical protein [Chitinophaga terrae (ex Kim and Jung 2007)]SDZ95409.1 hypothetical protein SAMN05660909_00312 [Chitinophaga terrae (ex Kim and Jung 2007)]